MKGVLFCVLLTPALIGRAADATTESKPLSRTLPTTRAHVLPPGEIEFEQWWRVTAPRDGSASHLFRSEIEAGLPGRFHLALYENYELTARNTFRHRGVSFEGRWAFADYGELPLNPTLYGEWNWNDEAPDKYELKLLLAEDLTEKWWWAFNAIYEQEVSGGRETEWGFTQALMYKIRGRKLAAGVEMKYEQVTENGSRSDPDHEFLIGPSLLWKIHDRIKLKAAPLFGLTGDSPQVQGFVIVEAELWEPAHH
jgi:hypothetical protein